MTKRTKAIAGLAGVFLLGGICGALVFGVMMRDRAREARDLRNRDGFLRYFEKRLDLTAAQRDSLQEELEWTYGELARLREETTVQYNALIDTFAVRVMPVLTEEQRVLFRTQEQKFRRFMPKELRGPHPPMRGDRPAGPQLMRPEHQDAEQDGLSRSSVAPPVHERSVQAKQEQTASVNSAQPPDTSARPLASSAPNDEGAVLRMGRRMRILRARLNLTDKQTIAVQQAFTRMKERCGTIKKDYSDQAALRHQKSCENIQELDREVLEQLDDNQRELWTVIRQEMSDKKHDRARPNQDHEAGQ